jgi:osmotically inducible protein OsmC
MAVREGTAEWRGDLQTGNGTVTVASGLFDGKYSFKTRFEDEPGTNPEELIGAAHAACFSMALSNMLAQHGHPATSIKTSAKVHLRMLEAGPTITRIDLTTVGEVPGIDEAHFAEHAAQAKEGCVISRALAGVEEITLTATLA